MSDINNKISFEDIVRKRYSTKIFDEKKLPETEVNRLLEMIRQAPSSFNVQPWKIIVISNNELKEKLSPASFNQTQIKSCSHLLVFCANKDILGNINRLEKLMVQNGDEEKEAHTHTDVIRNFEKNLTEEQKLSWAQRQTYLALANAINGAKSLGFDSCPMEGFKPDEYAKILNLPKTLVPTALCALGYAKDKPEQKLRFPSKEVFSYMGENKRK